VENGNEAILHDRAPNSTDSQFIRQQVVNGKPHKARQHSIPTIRFALPST
jgi:hypothetical protein